MPNNKKTKRGNVIDYRASVTFTVKLESGHSWGDLLRACNDVHTDLKKYSGFNVVYKSINDVDHVLPCVNFTCVLKPNASLALAEMQVYRTLAKHSIA